MTMTTEQQITEQRTYEETLAQIQAEGAKTREDVLGVLMGRNIFPSMTALTAVMLILCENTDQKTRETAFIMMGDLAQNIRMAFGITDERIQELMIERSSVMVVLNPAEAEGAAE